MIAQIKGSRHATSRERYCRLERIIKRNSSKSDTPPPITKGTDSFVESEVVSKWISSVPTGDIAIVGPGIAAISAGSTCVDEGMGVFEGI